MILIAALGEKGSPLVIIAQHEDPLLIEGEPRREGILLHIQQIQQILNTVIAGVAVFCFGDVVLREAQQDREDAGSV